MSAEALNHLVARYISGEINADEYYAAVDVLAATAIADAMRDQQQNERKS